MSKNIFVAESGKVPQKYLRLCAQFSQKAGEMQQHIARLDRCRYDCLNTSNKILNKYPKVTGAKFGILIPYTPGFDGDISLSIIPILAATPLTIAEPGSPYFESIMAKNIAILDKRAIMLGSYKHDIDSSLGAISNENMILLSASIYQQNPELFEKYWQDSKLPKTTFERAVEIAHGFFGAFVGSSFGFWGSLIVGGIGYGMGALSNIGDRMKIKKQMISLLASVDLDVEADELTRYIYRLERLPEEIDGFIKAYSSDLVEFQARMDLLK